MSYTPLLLATAAWLAVRMVWRPATRSAVLRRYTLLVLCGLMVGGFTVAVLLAWAGYPELSEDGLVVNATLTVLVAYAAIVFPRWLLTYRERTRPPSPRRRLVRRVLYGATTLGALWLTGHRYRTVRAAYDRCRTAYASATTPPAVATVGASVPDTALRPPSGRLDGGRLPYSCADLSRR